MVGDAIRMAEISVIAEGERLELVDGRPARMTPEGEEHLGEIGSINTLLTDHYRPPSFVYTQATLRLDEVNLRQPDFYVTDVPVRKRRPLPDEIALIVEVFDTSLGYDLGTKGRTYAAWGAPHYWVVDLRGRRVVAHSTPEPDGYRDVTTLAPGQRLILPRIDAGVDVALLLA